MRLKLPKKFKILKFFIFCAGGVFSVLYLDPVFPHFASVLSVRFCGAHPFVVDKQDFGPFGNGHVDDI